MEAFHDVFGIQLSCMKVLPLILEDEKHRKKAQKMRLADVLFSTMVRFKDSVELHAAAFHTLVLLARPLGLKKGMLFRSAIVDAALIFNGLDDDTNDNNRSCVPNENGINTFFDSIKRFAHDENLQAKSCWSMVNIALIQSQKSMLIKSGGLRAIVDAMQRYPFSAEVQFRALSALINLVIPSDLDKAPQQNRNIGGDVSVEKKILDEHIGHIINLVVTAMNNFRSNKEILKKACIVLQNVSLNSDHHRMILWNPKCYDMLQWCMENHRNDLEFVHSAGGTFRRLQSIISHRRR